MPVEPYIRSWDQFTPDEWSGFTPAYWDTFIPQRVATSSIVIMTAGLFVEHDEPIHGPHVRGWS